MPYKDKELGRQKAKERYKIKRAERAAYLKNWHASMTPEEKEEYVRKKSEYDRELYRNWTPEEKAAHVVQGKRNRLKKIGWSPEYLAEAEKNQQGRCAICKKVSERLGADHKHVIPPIPRALLCVKCNLGLGSFEDNPEFLRSAVEYLLFYESRLAKAAGE